MTVDAHRSTIYVVSDATAETAERVLRAALIQFDDLRPDVRVYSLVRRDAEVAEILDRAATAGASARRSARSDSRNGVVALMMYLAKPMSGAR